LRLFSFGGYGLALVALALVVFGAIECPPQFLFPNSETYIIEIHVIFERMSKNLGLTGVEVSPQACF